MNDKNPSPASSSLLRSSLALRQALATFSHTQAEDWFLCLKARFGMAVVFSTLRAQKGPGSILTCPYTCITAINPILAAKLTPIYADIDRSTLFASRPLAKFLHHDTHALIMQHTLGMIGDKSYLRHFCDSHKLLLIEDSAHALGRFARSGNASSSSLACNASPADSSLNPRPNLPLADISIHSFGVEKVLTRTKFGGAIYLNPCLKKTDPALYEALKKALLSLPAPNPATALRVRIYRPLNAVLQRLPQSMKGSTRQLATKLGLLEAAIFSYEQEGKQASPVSTNLFVNQQIIAALPSLMSNYKLRQKNVSLYFQAFQEASSLSFHNLPAFAQVAKEPLLAYPILFSSPAQANAVYLKLKKAGFFIRRWYSPLLFPGPKNNHIYHYHPSSCPIAEDVSLRILCLPTDLPPAQTKKLIALLH